MSDKIRLLNINFEFCDFDEDNTPPYAILSHTWSENNEEEVTYQDLKDGTSKSKLKLELCERWAQATGYEYFWIDTCCIDMRNDAELRQVGSDQVPGSARHPAAEEVTRHRSLVLLQCSRRAARAVIPRTVPLTVGTACGSRSRARI
jgi:hypothetical protein